MEIHTSTNLQDRRKTCFQLRRVQSFIRRCDVASAWASRTCLRYGEFLSYPIIFRVSRILTAGITNGVVSALDTVNRIRQTVSDSVNGVKGKVNRGSNQI